MGQQISINDLQREIGEVLQSFNHSCETFVDVAAKETAATGAKLLRTYSPRKSGNYGSTWTYRQTKRGTCYIFNSKNYRLTHLLEKGHRTVYKTGRYGSRQDTISKPHISIVEEIVQEEFPKKIAQAIEYQR
jgi:hypothetical protein